VTPPRGGEGSPPPPPAPTPGRAAVPLEAWLFLALGSAFGVFAVFFTPPGQGLDEPNHWARAYTLSEGSLVAERRGTDGGGRMPACAYEYVRRVQETAADPGPMPRGRFWATPAGCERRMFVGFNNTAVYTALPYAPPAVGLAVTRAVGLPVPAQFYAGRLAALGAYVLLGFAALRLAARCRLTIFVLAAMPMSLLSASSYSADSITLALVLLLGAAVTRCLSDEAARRRAIVVLIAAAFGLALAKPPYVILAALLLLVPAEALGGGRRSWWVKAGLIAGVVVVAGSWYLVVRDISLGSQVGADREAQLRHVTENPRTFVVAVYRGFLDRDNEESLLRSTVSWVGNFRARPAGGPLLLAVVAAFLVVLSYKAEAGRWLAPPGGWCESPHLAADRPVCGALARQKSWSGWVGRLGADAPNANHTSLPGRRLPDGVRLARAALPTVLALAGAGIICLIEYLTFTPLHAPAVSGLQGRYFLPLLLMPALTVAMLREPPSPDQARVWCFGAAAAFLLVAVALQVRAVFYT
jgi:uncharacterized membrane protein